MKKKLLLWAISCLAISPLFLNNVSMPSLLQLKSTGLYPWAVLSLCILWIYIKRDELSGKMQTGERLFSSLPFALMGGLIVVLAIFLPGGAKLADTIFKMLLSYLGLFVLFFGRAGLFPGILLGIYGFSLGFPLVVDRFIEPRYSLSTVWMVVSALKVLGFPLVGDGQFIHFLDVDSKKVTIFVNAACSGVASMSIFIALFALMMLDIRMPPKSALYLAAFGIIGTSVQNVLRLIILIIGGHYYNYKGVAITHSYAGYIMFPIWFAIFVFVYMRHAKKIRQEKGGLQKASEEPGDEKVPATL